MRPSRPSAQTAPVKKSTAVSVSKRESRLISFALVPPFFFFAGFALLLGRTFMPQNTAGSPSNSVMLVTLFTSELVSTSVPDPPLIPSTNAKIKLPMPEQYGMINVPRTVPSTPLAVMDSSRQIIRKEVAMKRPKNNHGAHAPLLSTHLVSQFKRRS